MGWVYLIIAILLEVAGTTALKYSEGLTKPWPTTAMAFLYAAAFAMLAMAIKSIELSTAYAIWSALGTAIIAVIAIAIFGAPLTWGKVISLGLVIIGVVGLHLSGSELPVKK
ncbi:MAG: multidrug efflux SMR transporter [Rhodospirillaceae bacterium]|nr:multidrug efflux SMR transporter [Rhodospirillaceae bacterium]MCY4237167.1 multidrug efflux SMR transporter [Rhodospirillaceae bacterium]MCY4311063.1 multidrug efflux SMR transporter [Rhodospirillaceae bacterium]